MKNPYIIAAVVIAVILLFVFASSAFAKSPDKITPEEREEEGAGGAAGGSNLQNLVADVLATGGDNSSCGKTCRQLCATKKPSLWPFDCGSRCKCKRSCKSDCAAGKDVTKIAY